MWKPSDVQNGKSYYLALVQSETGDRDFLLQEGNMDQIASGTVFSTEPVPNELLIKRNLKKISESILLVSGEHFYVDAHGIWITDSEMSAIMEDKDDDEVPWVNGMAPNFAPK